MERSILENGIQLGGVFRDYHERVSKLESENARLVEENDKLVSENELRLTENEELQNEFKRSASSLTREQSSHMAALDILNQARSDKDDMERKFASALTDCALKDEQLAAYKAEIGSFREALDVSTTKLMSTEQLLGEEREENVALTAIIDARDESIEELRNKVAEREEEIKVLQHSLAAKDKQLISVCRDRDRLKDRIEAAKATMQPAQRAAFDRTSSGKLLAPPSSAAKVVERVMGVASSSSFSGKDAKTARKKDQHHQRRVPLGTRSTNSSGEGPPSQHGGAAKRTTAAVGVGSKFGEEKYRERDGAEEQEKEQGKDKGSANLDLDLDLDDLQGFSVRERMLRGIIRRLRQELAAAKPCTF